MAIFEKKGKDLDEETNKNSFDENRKITKDLKDLKPENKKKRKEPPKPWSRKERILVLVVLVATTIISAILLLSNYYKLIHGGLNLQMPRFKLDSINPFKGETIIIRKK